GVRPGTVSHSAFPQPTFVKPVAGAGFVKSSVAKWLVVGFALVAVVLLAYGLLGLAFGRSPGLDTTLRPYLSGTAAPPAGAAPRHVGPFTMAETAVVQRAVEATARVARQQGLLQRVEALLEQADLPLRAAELIFFNAVALVVLTVIAGLVEGLLAGLVVAVVVGLGPSAVLSFVARRRQLQFTSQLPDTLQLLAGTLRSGYSLLQGAEIVSQVVVDPMGRELKRIIVEGRLGRSLDDAFADCAARMGSRDFDWAVMAINIQREVGGNLAELLTTVAETMIHRERLRREIKALTAEGRMSAIVLGLLPVGLGVIMYTINPEYMRVLFQDSFGKV